MKETVIYSWLDAISYWNKILPHMMLWAGMDTKLLQEMGHIATPPSDTLAFNG